MPLVQSILSCAYSGGALAWAIRPHITAPAVLKIDGSFPSAPQQLLVSLNHSELRRGLIILVAVPLPSHVDVWGIAGHGPHPLTSARAAVSIRTEPISCTLEMAT
jgi:hypothetical protein